VGRGFDGVEIELLDLLRVLQDLSELTHHSLTFGLVQRKARQPGNVIDGLSIDGHDVAILVGYLKVMAFPRSLLADHEKLVFELRPHWVSAVPPLLWTLVLLVGLFLGYQAMEAIFSNESTQETAKSVVGGLFTLAWIYLAVIPFLRWRFTFFVLTSDRLITRSGIIAKHSKEIPLERINDVAFTQTVLERVLGAGDLLVESAGERGQTRIANVRKPEQVQLMIYKETEANTERTMQPRSAPTVGASQTIPDQIEALARLRKAGAISEEEFQTKKKDLLDRM
jgi:membrane protein YdbS with pleckstrin-like domain